jgi:AraC-like DNA-binding protein
MTTITLFIGDFLSLMLAVCGKLAPGVDERYPGGGQFLPNPAGLGLEARMSRLLTLVELLERQTRIDGNYPTAIGGLTLYRHAKPSPPTNVLYEPALCVIAQGSKRIMLGDREYRYDAARYLLIAADVPATARIVAATAQSPYLSLKLVLDPLEVGELVAQLGPRQQPSPATGALAVSALDPALLDSVIRLVELLDSPQDAQVLAPLVRREITYRLLVGPEGQRLRQVIAGNDQGQRITHALRWLKAHYAEPLRVESLAKQAGMSPSALHRHFKAVTAQSPLQYQKHLRLQEARRLMLGDALDAAEASFKVGYESPTQFSREYRRLFGAPPGRDIEALRQGPIPVVSLALAKGRRSASSDAGAPFLAALAEQQ